MEQRKLRDANDTVWTCKEARLVSGTNGENANSKALKRNGRVPVICTPESGSTTVRLELPEDWAEQLSDQELVDAIVGVRDKS